MARQQREQVRTYVIPQNFIDKMTVAGGMIRLRNLVEAILIVSVIIVPLIAFVPISGTAKLYIGILFGIPLFVFGCIGLNGDSLFQFLKYWSEFRKNRRISRYNPHIKKPDNIRESLKQTEDGMLPRDKIRKKISELTGRTFEVEDQDFEKLYDDVSMTVKFDDDDTVLTYGYDPDASTDRKSQRQNEKRERQLAVLGAKSMKELRFDRERKELSEGPREVEVSELEEITQFIEQAKKNRKDTPTSFKESVKNIDVSRLIREVEVVDELDEDDLNASEYFTKLEEIE